MLPQRFHHHWADQGADRALDVHPAELPRVDSALDGAGEEAHAALDHMLVIELRNPWEVARLRHHQLRNAAELRRAEKPPPALYQFAQQISRTSLEVADHLLTLGDGGDHRAFDDRLEQRFLAVEVQVERSLRDAGAGSNVVEPGCRKSFFDEEIERRRDQLLGAVFRPALTACIRLRTCGSFP